jgi:hypothetical protein
LDRITHSHSVISRKHGIHLDPNFADWLSEQIHQVTGEQPEFAAAPVSPVAPFLVAGTTVTPIHCKPSKVLILIPTCSEPDEDFWFRLRAVMQASQRAGLSNLDCHVRALSDSPAPSLRRLLDNALAEGLIDEWIDARKPDYRLSVGILDGYDFAAWIGSGLVNRDWITRLVQSLQFSRQGEFLIAHTATVLLKVRGQEIRLDRDDADPMFDPLGASHCQAFMATRLQWQRFDSGFYSDATSELSRAARGWLCCPARPRALSRRQRPDSPPPSHTPFAPAPAGSPTGRSSLALSLSPWSLRFTSAASCSSEAAPAAARAARAR